MSGRLTRWPGHVARTVRGARRVGPAPTDDAGWARQVRGWVEAQVPVLCAQVDDAGAGRPTPCPEVVGPARRLWSLARLQRHDIGGAAVADRLESARLDLARFVDPDHGGVVWAVAPGRTVADGEVVDDAKVLYGQCFAAFALAELARARPDGAGTLLDDAADLLLRAAARRTPTGVVDESARRDWSDPAPGRTHPPADPGAVSLDGQLHLVEAAAAVVEAGGDEAVRRLGAESARFLADRFLGVEPCTAVSAGDGVPRPGPRSLGHEVEAAWLLAAHAPALGLDPAIAHDLCARVVDGALAAGLRHDGLDDEPWPRPRPGGRRRCWWSQAELVRALVEVDDGPDGPRRHALRRVLGWMHRRHVDPRTGQARQLVTTWGLVLVTGESTGAQTTVGGAGGGPNAAGSAGGEEPASCAGRGASTVAPGAGGSSASGTAGLSGTGSDGGDGALDLPNPQGAYTGGGGGGGGWFGGGGGAAYGNSICGGGGGGSGYAHPSVTGIGGGTSFLTGEGRVAITFSSAVATPAPANDSYRAGQILSGLNGTVAGTLVGATADPGEPAHVGAAPEHSVWYRIGFSDPRRVRLDTQGSAVDTRLAVYHADPDARTFTLVAENDDASDATTASEVTVNADGDFYVAVDGKAGATGAITLNWLSDPPRPDGRVRAAGATTFLGDDVHGPPTPGQAVVVATPRGRSASFVVSVQNDSAFAERLRLEGRRLSGNFTATYRSPGGTNITTRVAAGTFRTPLLAPGATYAVRLTIAVPADVRAGVARGFPVTVTSTAPGMPLVTDTVRPAVRAT